MTQLTISLNNQIIKRVKLNKPSYIIGRHPHCDIVLPERTVSSQHARLINAGEDCFLEDLESTNGVYVNHLAIKKHLLMDGDLVSIGKFQIQVRSPASLNTQLRHLSIHPRLLDNDDIAMLEIRKGRKKGHVIPLNRDLLNLGEHGVGNITIERNQAGDYLLHTLSDKKVKTVSKLQDEDSFELGEIEFQFHQAHKTATL